MATAERTMSSNITTAAEQIVQQQTISTVQSSLPLNVVTETHRACPSDWWSVLQTDSRRS